MVEDKLAKHERIRLEALNQAVSSCSAVPLTNTVVNILDRAKKFEDYIRGIGLDDGV